MDRTDLEIGTPAARESSPPVRYELVDREGRVHPINVRSAQDAAKTAALYWPGQQQDPDRTGAGWDVQVAGS